MTKRKKRPVLDMAQLHTATIGMQGRQTSKARWRPKHEPGRMKMNKTEAAFEQLLAGWQREGRITGYAYEPFRLRIGKDWKTTYTPDFLVLRSDGQLELIDVKGGGGWEEDARVKIKTAARLYPMLHWSGYTKQRDGSFLREEF